PIAVAWHAVRIGMEKLHRPLAASRLAIIGGGAIGLAAALVARHFGAKQIVIGEPNALRQKTIATLESFEVYEPQCGGPEANSIDLVIDAVGAQATRTAASSMVKPGGVIVHAGLLPGHEGFDIRKITLQEITLTGTYCYTPQDFISTVEAIERGWMGSLGWMEERALINGAEAFTAIDNGLAPTPKIVLRC
ncbi:MAG: zinc-binding dehydrogenase, partial [Beijerinckiaceae bacterium]